MSGFGAPSATPGSESADRATQNHWRLLSESSWC
jgi:hypothetical protein